MSLPCCRRPTASAFIARPMPRGSTRASAARLRGPRRSLGAAVTGCLTDRRNARTNGTALRVEACTAMAAQRWSLAEPAERRCDVAVAMAFSNVQRPGRLARLEVDRDAATPPAVSERRIVAPRAKEQRADWSSFYSRAIPRAVRLSRLGSAARTAAKVRHCSTRSSASSAIMVRAVLSPKTASCWSLPSCGGRLGRVHRQDRRAEPA